MLETPSTILLFCFTLTVGCGGNKHLDCEKDYTSSLPNNNSGISKYVYQVSIDFESNKIHDTKLIYKYEIEDKYKEMIDDFVKQAETGIKSQLSKVSSLNITSNKTSDKAFEVVVSFDFSKLTASEKAALQLNKGSETYTANKKSLEQQNFTCK